MRSDGYGFHGQAEEPVPDEQGAHQAERGLAAGDPYLDAEGRSQPVSGATKQVGEQVKDAGKNVRGAFKK